MDKLTFKTSRISVYLTKSVDGRAISFVWSPPPSPNRPYTEAEIKEIDESFIPWAKRVLGAK